MTCPQPRFDPHYPTPDEATRLATMAAKHLEELLVMQLPMIDALSRRAARRYRMSPQDVDDFASIVRLRLVENDYGVLRQFRGRGSLRNYLTIVITRLCLDHVSSEWGRWRVSTEAKRLGPVAERLETMVLRDKLPIDAACAALAAVDVHVTPADAAKILARLPVRTPRRHVGEEALENVAGPTAAPDALWPSRHPCRVPKALAAAIAGLAAPERRLLKLRFYNHLTIATIARRYGLDQKALYRKVSRLLEQLRAELERQGIDATDGDVLRV